jgi:hypothetical protein
MGRVAVSALHRIEVAGADLAPEGAGNLAVAAEPFEGAVGVGVAAGSGTTLALLQDVVLTFFDRLGGEDGLELVALWVFVSPLLDRREHVSVELYVVVAKARMVESSQDIVGNFVDRHSRILPRVEDTAVNVRVSKHCSG